MGADVAFFGDGREVGLLTWASLLTGLRVGLLTWPSVLTGLRIGSLTWPYVLTGLRVRVADLALSGDRPQVGFGAGVSWQVPHNQIF